jgi:hypothetical protein
MRVLLDECVNERLRHLFHEHYASARYAGFASLKNGDLLLAAEAGGFQVIVPAEQRIPRSESRKSAGLVIDSVRPNQSSGGSGIAVADNRLRPSKLLTAPV